METSTKEGRATLNPECVPFTPCVPLYTSSPKLNPFSKPFTPTKLQAQPRPLPHRRLPEGRSEKSSISVDSSTDHGIKPMTPATSDLTAESKGNKSPTAGIRAIANTIVQDKAAVPPHLRSRPKDLESNGEASSEDLLRLLMPSTDVFYNKENVEPSLGINTKDPGNKQKPKLQSPSLSDQKAMDAWFEAEERKQRSPSRPPISTTTSTATGAIANLSHPAVVPEALPSGDDLIDLDSAFMEAPDTGSEVEATSNPGADFTASDQTSPDQAHEDSEDAYTGIISAKGRAIKTAVPISAQLEALGKRATVKEEALYGRRVRDQKEEDIAKFLAAYASGMETVQEKYSKAVGDQQEETNASWIAPASARSPHSEFDHYSDDEQGYVAPRIIGTHVLGEHLDQISRAMVVRPTPITNETDYVKSAQKWKSVVKDGRKVYVL